MNDEINIGQDVKKMIQNYGADKASKKLECPFTWDIDETLSHEFIESETLATDFDEEPLFVFITSIAFAYFAAENNKKCPIEKIKIMDDYWIKLDKGQLKNFEVSTRVLCHIKDATKYYIYKLTDRSSEAECVLQNLETAENYRSPSELATINGCKSVVWSNFFRKAHTYTTESARLAILGNPNCPLWYYVLGNSLKRARGEQYHRASIEEEEAILKSVSISHAPFYKMRLAQIYKEKKQYWMANKIYLEIYQANLKGQDISLRLAREFTKAHDFEKAKVCFEKAEKYPKNFRYHTYKGEFYMKLEDYEKAAFHYREAESKLVNYRLLLVLGKCLSKLDKNFDFIDYLKGILKNFESINPMKYQLTLLHIAMNYYYKKNDVENAMRYLLEAIEFDPQSELLKHYNNGTINWITLNVYDFLQENLIEFQNQVGSIEEMQSSVEKLRYYCHNYYRR